MKHWRDYWKQATFHWVSFHIFPKNFWKYVVCGRATPKSNPGNTRWGSFCGLLGYIKRSFFPFLCNFLLTIISGIWSHYLIHWQWYWSLFVSSSIAIAAIYFGFIK